MPFNLFKKKKREPKEELQKRESEIPEEKPAGPGKEISVQKKRTENSSSLPTVLRNPHITEKATRLGEKGQYVFKVHPQATKNSVKQSVEALYGVLVQNVRLIKKPTKKIRVGKREGIQQGLKKAIVQLKQGESIEVISR